MNNLRVPISEEMYESSPQIITKRPRKRREEETRTEVQIKRERLLLFLIHLNVIIFDFFFLSSFLPCDVLGAFLSPYHWSLFRADWFSVNIHEMLFLFQYFYDFFFIQLLCSLLMLHWSQDYHECVFVRLLNFDFHTAEEETKYGKIRKPIHDSFVVEFILHISASWRVVNSTVDNCYCWFGWA